MLSIDTSEYMREWTTFAEVQNYDPENRDSKTRDTDKQVGDLAEAAFAELLTAFGVKFQWEGLDEAYDNYDFRVYSEARNEWATVDVKCRKLWHGYKDLIVQTGRNGDKCADVTIQALIPKNPEEVHITGYETREEPLQADTFGGATGETRRQVKKIVDHDDLHNVGEIFPEFEP